MLKFAKYAMNYLQNLDVQYAIDMSAKTILTTIINVALYVERAHAMFVMITYQ
ncbi:MAG: hypothetical protein QXJ56_01245 [Ignisphaera sp.]